MNQKVSLYPNDHTTELQEAEDPEVAGRGRLRALPGQGSPELGAELSPTQDIRARVEGDSPGTLGWAKSGSPMAEPPLRFSSCRWPQQELFPSEPLTTCLHVLDVPTATRHHSADAPTRPPGQAGGGP